MKMLPASSRRRTLVRSERRRKRGHHAARGRIRAVCSCFSSPFAMVVVLSLTLLMYLLVRQAQSILRLKVGRSSDVYISRGNHQHLRSRTLPTHQRRHGHAHRRQHRHRRRNREQRGRSHSHPPHVAAFTTASEWPQQSQPRAPSASLCQPAAAPPEIRTEARLRREVLGADAVHITGKGHFAACSRGCAAQRIGSGAQAPSSTETVLLVVSHYERSLAWLSLQPFCYVVMRKSKVHVKDSTKLGPFESPNRANEASSYLRFIHGQYEHLPHHVLFVQDERVSPHGSDLVSMLRALMLPEQSSPHAYFSLNNVYYPVLDPPAYKLLHTFWSEARLESLGFGPFDPAPARLDGIALTCCAQFGVTRARLRRVARHAWHTLYRWAVSTADEGHNLLSDSFRRGECLELAWHRILGQAWRAPRLSASELCPSAPSACPQNGSLWRVLTSADRKEFWGEALTAFEQADGEFFARTMEAAGLSAGLVGRPAAPVDDDVGMAPIVITVQESLAGELMDAPDIQNSN